MTHPDHTHRRSDEVGAADQELVRHEESDVNVRAIFGFVAVLLTLGVVIHLALWGLMAYFDRREARASAVLEYPLAAGETPVPPAPRLQETPRLDLEALRAREDAVLNGYAWVDKAAGQVRIPIEEAMKLTVQRGLPVRETSAIEDPGK